MSRIGLTSHGFDAGSEAMRPLAYWTGVALLVAFGALGLWALRGSLARYSPPVAGGADAISRRRGPRLEAYASMPAYGRSR